VKEPNAKKIHKEMRYEYVGKCLSREAVQNLVADGFADDEEFETEMGKWQ
jgi:hypothetical protein